MIRDVKKPRKNLKTGEYEVEIIYEGAVDPSYLRFFDRDEAWKVFCTIGKETND